MTALAVIIAAYRASPWLEACLDSVREAASRRAMYAPVEIRLGIDACEATAATCERLGLPYWWARENVGTYVLRNSLVGLQFAVDAYVMFDADDVMRRDALVVMGHALDDGRHLVGPSRFDCSPDLVAMGQRQRYVNGVCAISDYAWTKLGGYRTERYGADADFIERARLAGLSVHVIEDALYYRRIHPASLTQDRATGPVSAPRLQACARMVAQRRQTWRVEPSERLRTPLQWRVP